MRIPISVIVMSLLTAVPFGLGIRETLTKKQDAIDDAVESERRERAAIAEMEAEAAREADENAAKRRASRAKLDEVFGKTPATMGPFLAGIALGAPMTEDLRNRMERTIDAPVSVSFDETKDTVTVVTVVVEANGIDDDSVCEDLRAKLVAAWGPSTNSVWLDPAAHQRASLNIDSCELKFESYLDGAAWVAALPFAALGGTAESLAAMPSVDIGDELITWSMPGAGYGVTPTEINARTENGKVGDISVDTDADFDTVLAIRDALTAKVKAKPVRNDDTGAWVWKKKPVVTLEQSTEDNRFTLHIGRDLNE